MKSAMKSQGTTLRVVHLPVARGHTTGKYCFSSRGHARGYFRCVFQGKKALITLGPTREHLDPVRFFSNASSGKLGLAVARAFQSLGANVFLVCGPGVPSMPDLPSISVVSARSMFKEVGKRFLQSDFFVSCAAVSDYRPADISAKKIHKNKGSLRIRFIRNPDVLASMAQKKTKQFCVGFALEDSHNLKSAMKKLWQKNCDLFVLNTLDSLNSNFIRATIIFPEGGFQKLGRMSKAKFAGELCKLIASIIHKNGKVN